MKVLYGHILLIVSEASQRSTCCSAHGHMSSHLRIRQASPIPVVPRDMSYCEASYIGSDCTAFSNWEMVKVVVPLPPSWVANQPALMIRLRVISEPVSPESERVGRPWCEKHCKISMFRCFHMYTDSKNSLDHSAMTEAVRSSCFIQRKHHDDPVKEIERNHGSNITFFPTCQVRVVRFYIC